LTFQSALGDYEPHRQDVVLEALAQIGAKNQKNIAQKWAVIQ
jgi:hypothetical protein